jgi:hypothetical protein
MYFWVGRNTSPELLMKVFGVDKPEGVDFKMVSFDAPRRMLASEDKHTDTICA